MLLDEQPVTSRLFGMELGRMAFDGEIYDVENDFHGICFLYGWVGLAMMVAFIGYFLYLIVKCLIKDFRKYFTVEAGAFGIGLCLCLVYAYFTAGVLRRPNASIYMSVLLAAVYLPDADAQRTAGRAAGRRGETRMIFSVVIPVYNVKDYLPKCIDSVLAQDFEDYEVHPHRRRLDRRRERRDLRPLCRGAPGAHPRHPQAERRRGRGAQRRHRGRAGRVSDLHRQ